METNLFNGMSALGELRRSAERQLWAPSSRPPTMPKVRFLDRLAHRTYGRVGSLHAVRWIANE
jgi:hypothetical protein